ncbi:YdcF family protein [Shewanella submarina]|uniref:YdcF family protein n=1 Tax=Shewanella submarina TaxID=2016376 RepID=A0ABV7G9R6_9GAMM|nr:YdcF family protein [Shewanella submarina]MCL1039375.1 YdcF family protein [Shewanella submarina]
MQAFILQTLIIQLGAPNNVDGSLPAIANSRCHATFSTWQQYADAHILCTGGFGSHFNQTDNPHWHWSQIELQRLGVPRRALLPGIDSRFTFEDASLTLSWLSTQERFTSDNTQLLIVTSDFHQPRVQLIFDALFNGWHKHYISAPTPVPETEYQRLHTHELSVMNRERDNIARYFQQGT